VVGDEHQGSTRERSSHATGGIRDNQDFDAKLGEHARGKTGDGGWMTLVKMKAARLHDDGHTFERPRYQLAFVARDAGLWEARDLGIGNRDWGGDVVREKTEP
jgi:hypothetical protein